MWAPKTLEGKLLLGLGVVVGIPLLLLTAVLTPETLRARRASKAIEALTSGSDTVELKGISITVPHSVGRPCHSAETVRYMQVAMRNVVDGFGGRSRMVRIALQVDPGGWIVTEGYINDSLTHLSVYIPSPDPMGDSGLVTIELPTPMPQELTEMLEAAATGGSK